jgi:type IV secretion system protein VirD4
MLDALENPNQNAFIIGREETAMGPSYLLDEGEGHLMTVASTGAGKGVGCIIPNLLHYDGPAVVIDPKGEAYQVSAEYRRKMGQEVILLDPFNITGDEENKSSFNPLDIIRLGQDVEVDDVQEFSHMLVQNTATKDPFWDTAARLMCQGLLLHVAHHAPTALRNIAEVAYLANQSSKETEYTHKEMMRTKVPFVKKVGAIGSGFEPKVKASVYSVFQTHMECFNSEAVALATKKTSFDLKDFYMGKAMTIYIVLPPEKLSSHAALLRLWVGAFMSILTRRSAAPEKKTLLVIDEAAQLGNMPEITKMTTLLRGYGVRLWTFWQDLSQLKSLYPLEWKTLLNNCSTIQFFGFNAMLAVKEANEVIGWFHEFDMMNLKENEQVLIRGKSKPKITTRVNYLKENDFVGKHTSNARYDRTLSQEDAKKALGCVRHSDASTQAQTQLIEAIRKIDKLTGDADFNLFCRETKRLIKQKQEQLKVLRQINHKGGSSKGECSPPKNSNILPIPTKLFLEKETETLLREIEKAETDNKK